MWSRVPTQIAASFRFDGDTLLVSGEMPNDFAARDDAYHTLLTAYDFEGNETWRYAHDPATVSAWTFGSGVAPLTDGGHVFMDWEWVSSQGWQLRLNRLDAAHALAWRQTFTGFNWDDADSPAWHVHADGTVDLAAVDYPDGPYGSLVHARIKPDGSLAWFKELAPQGAGNLWRVHGTRLAVTGGMDIIATAWIDEEVRTCRVLIAVDAQGTASPVECLDEHVGPAWVFLVSRRNAGGLAGAGQWSVDEERVLAEWQWSPGKPFAFAPLVVVPDGYGTLEAGYADGERTTLALGTDYGTLQPRVLGFTGQAPVFDHPAPASGRAQELLDVAPRHRGGLLVASCTASACGDVQLTAVSRSGGIAWSRTFADVHPAEDGLVPVPGSSGEFRWWLDGWQASVVALAADGTERWRFDLAQEERIERMGVAEGGGTLLIASDFRRTTQRLLLLDDAGLVSDETPIASTKVVAIAALPSGAALLQFADGSLAHASAAGVAPLPSECGPGSASAAVTAGGTIVYLEASHNVCLSDLQGGRSFALTGLVSVDAAARLVPLPNDTVLVDAQDDTHAYRVLLDPARDAATPLALLSTRESTEEWWDRQFAGMPAGHLLAMAKSTTVGEDRRIEVQTLAGDTVRALNAYAPVGMHTPEEIGIDAVGAPYSVGRTRTCVGFCPIAVAQYRLDVLFADGFDR